MKGYRLVGIREGGPNEDLDICSSFMKALCSMARYSEEWDHMAIYAPSGILLALLNHEGLS